MGRVGEFDAKHPGLLQAEAFFKAANGEIKKLTNARKQFYEIEDNAERQRKVREANRQIRAIQMWANKAYKEMQEQW